MPASAIARRRHAAPQTVLAPSLWRNRDRRRIPRIFSGLRGTFAPTSAMNP
jgi:hypothetical protein